MVALGRIAFDASLALLRSRGIVLTPRPQFAHGAHVTITPRLALIGCYHPSRQNTNTGKLTPRMMDDVFERANRVIRARR
jgi:uracil-DNA glycosylase